VVCASAGETMSAPLNKIASAAFECFGCMMIP
jgi:hypothetical protein